MKQTVFVLTGLILISGCDIESSRTAQAGTPGPGGAGSFTARLGEQEYLIDVSCLYFATDSFTFRSLPGADVTVEGMQDPRGKFILTISDQGELYSTGRLESFEKGSITAQGSGTLYPEGGGDNREVTFSVVCGS